MLIGGFQKSSLIDYPEKISAIVFTQGCNFRCPYCHNPELISIPDFEHQSRLGFPTQHQKTDMVLNIQQIISFLSTRIGKLDGVVITGGEPTLQHDLPDFIKEIKALGFDVKLDTNGTNPKMLKALIDEKLIDYVAMDIKAPIAKYSETVCHDVNTDNILKSIQILKNSGIDYEYRTTVVKSQLSVDDFDEIAEMINGCKKYYLQRFLPTKTLNRFYMNQTTYSDDEFSPIIVNLKNHIPCVELR